jgi:hypothetical protein
MGADVMTRPSHPSKSDFKYRRRQPHKSITGGIHAFDTEARSLEQAVDILANRIVHKQAAETRKANANKPKSLRRQFFEANRRAQFLRWRGKISLSTGTSRDIATEAREKNRRPKPKHPFQDLPEDQKPAKAREMYASKAWGINDTAGRRLAKIFGVSYEVMSDWLGFKIHQAGYDYMAERLLSPSES